MKILIVTQYFHPENFKCNDIAFEMNRRGHDVTVLTSIPNYPQGKFYDGYGILKKRRETIDGVKIIRSLVVPRHDGSAKWLGLNYLSYTFFSSISALRLGLTKRFDVILVHEPSPVMVGIPAIIVKKIRKLPLHFWVLDLWPESLTAAGGIKNRKILGVFERLTKWIYKNCDTLLIGSEGYRKSIVQKGDFESKIEYFPNWVEDSLVQKSSRCNIPVFPAGFNVVVAGNMGDAQDLSHVMEAADKLKGTNINFIFVGDGRKREFVEQYSMEHGLQGQVVCLGRYPLHCMPQFFEKADLLFFALKDSPIFALTVPSRLQAYMSSGKPVVAMINGVGAELVKKADCGWSVPAESPDALAQKLLELSKTDPGVLIAKGINGRMYSEKYFNFQKCMDHLERVIQVPHHINE